jgi:hypothetical protein
MLPWENLYEKTTGYRMFGGYDALYYDGDAREETAKKTHHRTTTSKKKRHRDTLK